MYLALFLKCINGTISTTVSYDFLYFMLLSQPAAIWLPLTYTHTQADTHTHTHTHTGTHACNCVSRCKGGVQVNVFHGDTEL